MWKQNDIATKGKEEIAVFFLISFAHTYTYKSTDNVGRYYNITDDGGCLSSGCRFRQCKIHTLSIARRARERVDFEFPIPLSIIRPSVRNVHVFFILNVM